MFLFCSSGEFVVVNKHLLHDLTEMGIWTPTLKNQIIYEDGSVQKMTEIPDDLKAIYKFVFNLVYAYFLPDSVTVQTSKVSIQLLHQDCLGDQAENFG
jgi:ribonucleotide reductase alpha subunit